MLDLEDDPACTNFSLVHVFAFSSKTTPSSLFGGLALGVLLARIFRGTEESSKSLKRLKRIAVWIMYYAINLGLS